MREPIEFHDALVSFAERRDINMNEVEHFLDVEIERAKYRIKHGYLECFNGVKADAEIVTKLNIAHIEFCQNAKKFIALANHVGGTESKMEEMQAHIDCLKTELAEVQQTKQELPTKPIKVAEMLICASGTLDTNSIQRALGAGETANYDIYSKTDLNQIAEHLLVYCNNAEEE